MLDPKAETVGNVDIVFELNHRGITGKEWVARSIARAEATGSNLQYFDQISYGEIEVRLLLKARKPRLSLQPLSSFERLKPLPKFKMIFKAEAARPDKTKKQSNGPVRGAPDQKQKASRAVLGAWLCRFTWDGGAALLTGIVRDSARA